MVDFVKSIPELRARVPVTQQWAYFETASTGLVPDFVYDGVRRYAPPLRVAAICTHK